MEGGKYRDAYELFNTLDGYKDSADKAEECKAAAPYDFVNVGDVITFGHFEPDMDKKNGPEPVTWRVLDQKDGKVLILSEKVLDKMPFWAIYWKHSYIGGYINSDLLKDFTPVEKAMLVEIRVPADKHPVFPETDQGFEPLQKLFLLSVTEVQKYFTEPTELIAKATPYAIHEGLETEPDGTCRWWLRTACSNWSDGAVIASINNYGTLSADAHSDRLGLRPACWIQLESGD